MTEDKNKFVTIEDLEKATKDFVTKEDLEKATRDLVTKEDLSKMFADFKDELVKTFVTKEDLSKNFINNKWMPISCCDNNCLSYGGFNGTCISGRGFVIVSTDPYPLSLKYYVSGNDYDDKIDVYAANKLPKAFGKHYYFEITVSMLDQNNKVFDEPNVLCIGLRNNDRSFTLSMDKQINQFLASIDFEHDTIAFENNDLIFGHNDVFGCGLSYQPINSDEKKPFVYFTKNGQIVGKAITFSYDLAELQPFVTIKSCSISQTNFGADLFNWPFLYKPFTTEVKEFYYNEDSGEGAMGDSDVLDET
uniref:SPRY domain-containing protein n=1 Tax=Meloidogyne hapla TaxID=6305 RepID=A0A1I8BKU7_MELHA